MSETVVGVWMGLRRCGCPVAVCTVDTRFPTSDVEECKREFLADGLNVVYADRSEWLETYSPKFRRDCPHGRRAVADAGTPKQHLATAARDVPQK